MFLSFQSQGEALFSVFMNTKEDKKGERKYEVDKNRGIGKNWPHHSFEGYESSKILILHKLV
jgi:hypothetical protein